MTERGQTRRDLVRGATATSALALAATVPALLEPARALATSGGALAKPASDGVALASVLRVEQVVVFAYERTLTTEVLSPPTRDALTKFLDQERAHVHALSLELTSLGGPVPGPVRTMAAFESELRQLRIKRSPVELRTEREYLGFLIDLETVIARHYRFAIELLTGDKRLVVAAEIIANEAQHEAVLRAMLSPGHVKRAVPSAFIAGVS
jgi:demethoxyubiquinone hydroxylase (CLK1/Coq7/Cat5 family)